MILIPRRHGDPPPDDQTDKADIPQQSTARPDAVSAGDIARKSRAVATALQKLHGI